MAIAAKATGKGYYTYVICGDGELQEGVCWEGANMAAGRALDNLIVFVDKNGYQSYKTIDFTVGRNNPAERFEAFGWDVRRLTGTISTQSSRRSGKPKQSKSKPSCIVCNCVKAKA
jgi:transketolase